MKLFLYHFAELNKIIKTPTRRWLLLLLIVPGPVPGFLPDKYFPTSTYLHLFLWFCENMCRKLSGSVASVLNESKNSKTFETFVRKTALIAMACNLILSDVRQNKDCPENVVFTFGKIGAISSPNFSSFQGAKS